MARDNYEAGLFGESAGHDIFSPDYQSGARERERRALATEGGGGGGGAAGGGGGMLFGVIMVIVAFCAFVISFVTYPIAGITVLIAFLISAANVEGANFVFLVFALMVPCFIVYLFTFKVEKRAAQAKWYRTFRLYWRLVLGTFVVHEVGALFHRPRDYPNGAPLSAYLLDLALSAAGFVVIYLNSIRLDRKYELEPARNKLIDAFVDPIVKFLVPPVDPDIRETPPLSAKTDRGQAIEARVSADGVVTVGEDRVPVAQLSIGVERKHRVKLVFGGVILFFAGPIIIKNMYGTFNGFMPETLGLIGIIASVLLVVVGFYEKTPPGKLAGSFRYLNVGGHLLRLAASDERMLVRAVANLRGAAATPVVSS